jgi:hypothetical protein
MSAALHLPYLAPLRAKYVAIRVLTGVLLLALGYELWVAATNPLGVLHYWGADYGVYMEAARRFLAGGGFYASWQFDASVTDISLHSTVYPPIGLLLFVPFSLLPPPAWWIVPLGTIAYVARRQCRTDWQRVALLAALVSPSSITALVAGNGTLWVAAAVVAGNRWGWPAAFIVLKPSLAPWALVGIRSRGWWIVMTVLVVVSLAMPPMWFDWVTVISAWRAAPAYLPSTLSLELAMLWFATRRPLARSYAKAL